MEKKEQVQLAAIGIGAVVLAFVLVRNMKTAAKRPAAPAAAAAGSAVEPVVPSPAVRGPSSDKIADLQEKRWESSWGRDPFRAVSDTAGRLVELQLKGISFAPAKKGYAFINDRIVTAGDTVGSYTVSRIEKDKVLLTRSGQTFILSFIDNEGQ